VSIEGWTVALMVRNEEGRIGRALASARPVADRWLVIDTGSTDGTEAEIRNATRGWPGQLLHRNWTDFGTNRTDLVATAAESGARWVLMLDADHELVDHDQLAVTLARTNADALQLPYTSSPLQWVSRLLRCGPPWRYVGTVHEHLECDMRYRRQRLDNPRILDHADGASRATKWTRDLALLQAQTTAEPADARAWFYLGETHRGLRQPHLAAEAYLRSAEFAGPGELRYVALLYAGCLLDGLHRTKEAIEVLRQAVRARPGRREALLQLCQVLNRHGQHRRVLDLLGSVGDLNRPIPPEDLEGIYPPAYQAGLLLAERVRALTAAGGRRARLAGPAVSGDPRLHEAAACGLPTAHLFDERHEGESPAAFLDRVRWAEWTCLDCPVAEACGEFGDRYRLPGVFGGKLRTRAQSRPDGQLAAAAS
jgi:tetratricopeptide (TPR) repeat protein